MSIEQQFPSLPEFRAVWAPVYIEPIVGSGERLTVAIAAWSGSDVRVTTALVPDALDCAFGTHGKALYDQSLVIAGSLEEHLKAGRAFEEWRSPLAGVHVGPIRGAAGEDMTQVVRMALRRTASFSALMPLDDTLEVPAAESEHNTRFPDAVQAIVVDQAPTLDRFFNRSFNPRPGARALKVGFHGTRMAANFSELDPSKLADGFRRTQTRIVDLELLRDSHGAMPLQTYEVMVLKPHDTNPLYSEQHMERARETLLTLTEFCDRRKILLRDYSEPEQAAARIMKLEQAA